MIGAGYKNDYDGNANPRSGKDYDIATPVEAEDFFGQDVALDYDSTLNRHRLAVLARDDRGSGNASTGTYADHGAVYLFTFTDDEFGGGQHIATLGSGYDPELTVASSSDALTAGRGITGGTSGATGVVVVGDASSTSVTYTLTTGNFVDGETITEATSSYTRTVSEVLNDYTSFLPGETITEAASGFTRTIGSTNGSVKENIILDEGNNETNSINTNETVII